MRWLRNYLLVEVLLLAIACNSTPTTPTPPPTPTPTPTPVVVADPPALTCPSPVTTTTTAATGATVTYASPSATGGQSPLSLECTPPSGGTFPIGTTQVRCTATDGLNRTASCTFGVTVSRSVTLTRTKFVAFGDSVTLGVVSSINPVPPPPYLLREVPNDAYPTVLRQLLAARYTTQAQAITVINYGRGGERAVDGIGRAQSAFNAERPDGALIMEGYNDLSTLGEAGIDPAVAAIGEMAKDARFRGARVFIGTLTPPPPNVNRGISNTTITRFNERLRAMARGENAVLVDVYSYFAADPDRYNSADGRHPNEAGYRQIAQAFFDAIQREFEVR